VPALVLLVCFVLGLTGRCSDINQVIMEYLISEGYPNAAHKFALEANLTHEGSKASFEARVAIKRFIMSGRIEEAMESINDLNPEVGPLLASFRVDMIRLLFMHHS
jgi:glucose-induced degradation protein 8